MSKKIYILGLMVVLASFVFTTLNVYSSPGGRTGATRKSGTSGCSCHSSSTAITGAITTGGHDTVIVNQSYTFTLTITNTGGSGGLGCDIAVNRGTLAVISGQGLRLSSGELTHSSAISYSTPKTITFTYTAPSTAGTDIVYSTVDRGYSGRWAFSPDKSLVVRLATEVINNQVPVSYYVNQNFPNPFNPITKINYGVMKASNVKITVFDMLGREVHTIVNEYQAAGNYSALFDGSQYTSGVYFYKIEAGDFVAVKKMSLIK
jgi:hypothetical protein